MTAGRKSGEEVTALLRLARRMLLDDDLRFLAATAAVMLLTMSGL